MTIEDYAFCNNSQMDEISLNANLTSLGAWAFSYTNIPAITIPAGITEIKENTFSSCTNLKDVTFPTGLKTIAASAFYNTGLETITLPEGLQEIGNNAFNYCSKLQRVVIPEGVTEIGDYIFGGCNVLEEICFPSTLQHCGKSILQASSYATDNCPSLKAVKCYALIPPLMDSDITFSSTVILYVPAWSTSVYKLTDTWNHFNEIKPLDDAWPATISIFNTQKLNLPDEGLPLGYKPMMNLSKQDSHVGKLQMVGTGNLPLSKYVMEQTRVTNTMTALVNDVTMTADSVITNLTVSTGNWHFLSFPYDVKITDILTQGSWVIRRYDGAARAKGDYNNAWKTIPYDSILHAGEGYIWTSNDGKFIVPAINNESKNLIFSNESRYIPIKEHLATTISDNSWNLIGNPYPCFYDTRFMEYKAPITVRNGNSYAAYSPVDDNYILSPLEAFFVQRPSGIGSVGFTAEGRQIDNSVRELASTINHARSVNEVRKVFNICLKNNTYNDRTRFVINEKAATTYEMTCDAAKFMSDDALVPQLFTIENGIRMAINERPINNGEFILGCYIGKPGDYTLSLDTQTEYADVILIDKHTGVHTDLTVSDYTFNTEIGTFTNRFVIHMKDTANDIIPTQNLETKVAATADGIRVTNATSPVSVYTASGVLMGTQKDDVVTFDVPQGVYMVSIGSNVYKVTVIK